MAARIGLLLAALCAFGVAWWAGLFDLLSDPERIAELLRSLGPWGYVLYVAAFSLLEPFFVPGIVFILPATAIWPGWLAFVLSLLGSTGAGIVGFTFARVLARDWASAHIPDRLRQYDERLATRGLRTVIVMRLVLFLMPPAHWALGVSRVRFPTFVLGSVIGFVPGIAMLTFLGGCLFELLREQPPETWRWVGIGVLALFVLNQLRKRRRAQRDGNA